MTSKKEEQEKLDAALDDALDNLSDDDGDDDDNIDVKPPPPVQAKTASRPVQGPTPPPADDSMGSIDDMMKHLMQGNLDEGGDGQADEFLGKLLQEMQSHIGAELQQVQGDSQLPSKPSSPQKSKSPASSPKTKRQSSPSSSNNDTNDVDQAISSLIEGMTNQAKLDEPNPTSSNGISQDEMLSAMMGQLGEGLGGGDDAGFNADALIDGMMEQLLAKDLMYEPMKKVAEKFPAWLEENKGKLPQEEYNQ